MPVYTASVYWRKGDQAGRETAEITAESKEAAAEEIHGHVSYPDYCDLVETAVDGTVEDQFVVQIDGPDEDEESGEVIVSQTISSRVDHSVVFRNDAGIQDIVYNKSWTGVSDYLKPILWVDIVDDPEEGIIASSPQTTS